MNIEAAAEKRADDLAWAAGIIDGEGCICITKSHIERLRTPQFRIILKVTMGHRPTVVRLKEIFNVGTIQNHVARRDNVNASYSWICQARQVDSALKQLDDLLFTKRKEAAVAREFIALEPALLGGRAGNPKMPKRMREQRERLYWKLRKLKPRWRFYAKKEGIDG